MQPSQRFAFVHAGQRAALAAGVCIFAIAVSACSGPSEVAGFQRDRNFLEGDPMVAIGLRPRPQERISYNPRSPLVMPPQPELKTPKQHADLGPQWPDDPDERRAAQEEAERVALRERAVKEDRTQALSPEELDAWGREVGKVDTETRTDSANGGTRSVRLLSPAQLFRGRREEKAEDLTVEPPRRKLTEPPSGYRKAVADEQGQVVTQSQEEEAKKPKRRGIFSRLGF